MTHTLHFIIAAGLVAAPGRPAPAGTDQVGCRFRTMLKAPGPVSAAVYRAHGQMVRTLAYLQAHKPGSVELYWDGLDDFGRPCAPGAYTLRAVQSGVGVQYVMTLANGRQPSRPDDAGWVRAGRTVAVAPDGRVILAGQIGGESPKSLQVFSPDGKHVKSFQPIYQPCAVVTNGRHAYMTATRQIEGKRLAFVFRMDLDAKGATTAQVDYPGGPGGTAPFTDRTASGDPRYRLRAERLPRPIGGPWGAPKYVQGVDWWGVHSIALANGTLFLAVPSTESILVMDPATGKIRRTIPVEHVHAVAVGPRGRLYAIAGTQVLVMNPDGKDRRVFFSQGLEAPYDLAVDPKGHVVVIDQGGAPIPYDVTTPALVKIAPDGKQVWRIGAKGSRDGRVEPTRFWNPRDVAVDRQGNIYLTEPTLGRVQKFAPNGRFMWALVTIYTEAMCVDPDDPTQFYCTAGSEQVRRYVLDYDKRTWRLDGAWRRMMAPGKFMTVGMRMAKAHGRKFLAVWDGGLFAVNGHDLLYAKRETMPVVDCAGTAFPTEYDRKTGAFTVYEVPPSGYDLHGCPIYDQAKRRLRVRIDPTWNRAHHVGFHLNYHLHHLQFDDAGNLYVRVARRGRGTGVPYWARMWEQVFLQSYDPKGRLRWAVGRKTTNFVKPGEFYGPNRINVEGPFVYFTDVSGVLSIFDRQGLMVGFLMKDSARGFGVEDDLYGCGGESWVSYVATHPKTGRVYYYTQDHGTGTFRVYQITGLDTLQRWDARLVLKRAAPARPHRGKTKREFVARIFRAGRISLDGKLDEWTDQGAERLWAEQGNNALPHASLRFRYDRRFLYVAVHVRSDDTPAVNRNAGSRDLMWKGDCVELYVGTDIAAWRKGTYTPTDYQLMLAPGVHATGKAYCWTYHQWVDKSRVAWSVDADKRGYQIEAAVPWAFFRGPGPKAGRRLPLDMRVMCGDRTGEKYAYNLIWSARNMAFNRTDQWGQAILEQFGVTGEVAPLK